MDVTSARVAVECLLGILRHLLLFSVPASTLLAGYLVCLRHGGHDFDLHTHGHHAATSCSHVRPDVGDIPASGCRGLYTALAGDPVQHAALLGAWPSKSFPFFPCWA